MSTAERWALVRRVVPWIETLMKRYKVPVHLRDDLRHTVYLWIFDKAEGFDSERGALTTWTGWQFRGALRAFSRKHEKVFGPSFGKQWTQIRSERDVESERRYHSARSDRGSRAVLVSSDRAVLVTEQDQEAACERVDDEPRARAVALAIDALPHRERVVVVAIGSGSSLERAGSLIGVCRERARQIRNDAFARMRKRIGVQVDHRGQRGARGPKVTP